MAVKKKSSNPVGRPKKKYGSETLMDNKKSFKINNNNIVLDKYADALILMAIILIVACVVLYFVIK
ncbi:MAG: hypothetical protein ACI4U0_02195 [Candidatus Aphodocola sp.]